MKEYENDLRYLKEQFSDDGLTVPESLSEEAVFAMLEDVPQEPAAPAAQEAPAEERTTVHRTKRFQWRKPAAVLAACLCLVLGITAVHPWGSPAGPDEPATIGTPTADVQPALPEGAVPDENGLITCSSYEELDTLIASLVPEDNPSGMYDGGDIDIVYETAQSEDADTAVSSDSAKGASAPASSGPASAGSEPAHSDTYTQVEGIDEADIVKTDGKYIYYVSDFDNRIRIASVKDGKAENISSIRGDKCGTYITDLYIHGDQLVVIGDVEYDSFSLLNLNDRSATMVTLYDISDRNDPKQIDQYTQSGYNLSSRLNGDTLYLITNDYIYTYEKNHCFPCFSLDGTVMEDVAVKDICCFPEPSAPTFTVIGTLDLSGGDFSEKNVSTKAILGGSDEVYCSQEALYIASSFYPSDLTGDMYYIQGEDTLRTRIIRLSLDGDTPTVTGSAIVAGHLNDQFSMDDSNGVFKVATTTWRNGQDTNNLFLFDKDMKALGSVRDFAKDEHIEAVRYIKDKAYIITYEQTDPLFIIDLADPEEPEIVGHVKISGFSTLLVPAANDYLLGIGFSTDTTEWGEATDGLKLALFDIHDPAAPKVSDSQSFEGLDSEVQYNHKALLVGPNGDYYALPYEQWSYNEKSDDYDIHTGILVFTARDGKLSVVKDIKTDTTVRRCLYIEDYIYGLCEDDTIEGFKLPAIH